MKRFLILVVVLLNFSCDDGNFDISGFEFEDKITVCGEDKITLYRLSDDGHKEALIITLTTDQIKDSEEEIPPVSVTENGLYTVTDRVFDDEVTSSYFCSVIPPAEPKVTKDWRGVGGKILVENKAVYHTDGETIVAWEHIITLQDVVLKSGDDSLIFDNTYLFGTFQTGI
ncbi:MAG: hypothetical protein ABFR05_06575 [Bacteroidota bacterium]